MWKFITKSTRSVKCENLLQNQQGQSNVKCIAKSTRPVKCGNLLQNQQGQINVKMYYKINKASQM